MSLFSSNKTGYSLGENREDLFCMQDSMKGYFKSTREHSLQIVLPVMMLQVFMAFQTTQNCLQCRPGIYIYASSNSYPLLHLNFGKILFIESFFQTSMIFFLINKINARVPPHV